ncbi:MAG: hypothetical protein ABIH11_04770 [Candidatus Altiarchaeota archaeon]
MKRLDLRTIRAASITRKVLALIFLGIMGLPLISSTVSAELITGAIIVLSALLISIALSALMDLFAMACVALIQDAAIYIQLYPCVYAGPSGTGTCGSGSISTFFSIMGVTYTQDPVIREMNRVLIEWCSGLFMLAIAYTGIYLIFMAGSPHGRSQAKDMFVRLIVGMVMVAVSPMIFQWMIDITTSVSGELMNQAIAASPPGTVSFRIAFWKNIKYCCTFIVFMIILVLATFVAVLRFFAIYILACLWPLALFFYYFEFRIPFLEDIINFRAIGQSMIKLSVITILTQLIQAFFLAITLINLSVNSGSQMIDFILMCAGFLGVVFTPMIAMQLLGWIGGLVHMASTRPSTAATRFLATIMRGYSMGDALVTSSGQTMIGRNLGTGTGGEAKGPSGGFWSGVPSGHYFGSDYSMDAGLFSGSGDTRGTGFTNPIWSGKSGFVGGGSSSGGLGVSGMPFAGRTGVVAGGSPGRGLRRGMILPKSTARAGGAGGAGGAGAGGAGGAGGAAGAGGAGAGGAGAGGAGAGGAGAGGAGAGAGGAGGAGAGGAGAGGAGAGGGVIAAKRSGGGVGGGAGGGAVGGPGVGAPSTGAISGGRSGSSESGNASAMDMGTEQGPAGTQGMRHEWTPAQGDGVKRAVNRMDDVDRAEAARMREWLAYDAQLKQEAAAKEAALRRATDAEEAQKKAAAERQAIGSSIAASQAAHMKSVEFNRNIEQQKNEAMAQALMQEANLNPGDASFAISGPRMKDQWESIFRDTSSNGMQGMLNSVNSQEPQIERGVEAKAASAGRTLTPEEKRSEVSREKAKILRRYGDDYARKQMLTQSGDPVVGNRINNFNSIGFQDRPKAWSNMVDIAEAKTGSSSMNALRTYVRGPFDGMVEKARMSGDPDGYIQKVRDTEVSRASEIGVPASSGLQHERPVEHPIPRPSPSRPTIERATPMSQTSIASRKQVPRTAEAVRMEERSVGAGLPKSVGGKKVVKKHVPEASRTRMRAETPPMPAGLKHEPPSKPGIEPQQAPEIPVMPATVPETAYVPPEAVPLSTPHEREAVSENKPASAGVPVTPAVIPDSSKRKHLGHTVIQAKRDLRGSIRAVNSRLEGLNSPLESEANGARQYLAEGLNRLYGTNFSADNFRGASIGSDGVLQFGDGGSAGIEELMSKTPEGYAVVSQRLGVSGAEGFAGRAAEGDAFQRGGVAFVKDSGDKHARRHEKEHREDVLMPHRQGIDATVSEIKAFSRNVEDRELGWSDVGGALQTEYMPDFTAGRDMTREEEEASRAKVDHAVSNSRRFVRHATQEFEAMGLTPENARARAFKRLRNMCESCVHLDQFNAMTDQVLAGQITSRDAVGMALAESGSIIAQPTTDYNATPQQAYTEALDHKLAVGGSYGTRTLLGVGSSELSVLEGYSIREICARPDLTREQLLGLQHYGAGLRSAAVERGIAGDELAYTDRVGRAISQRAVAEGVSRGLITPEDVGVTSAALERSFQEDLVRGYIPEDQKIVIRQALQQMAVTVPKPAAEPPAPAGVRPRPGVEPGKHAPVKKPSKLPSGKPKPSREPVTSSEKPTSGEGPKPGGVSRPVEATVRASPLPKTPGVDADRILHDSIQQATQEVGYQTPREQQAYARSQDAYEKFIGSDHTPRDAEVVATEVRHVIDNRDMDRFDKWVSIAEILSVGMPEIPEPEPVSYEEAPPEVPRKVPFLQMKETKSTLLGGSMGRERAGGESDAGRGYGWTSMAEKRDGEASGDKPYGFTSMAERHAGKSVNALGETMREKAGESLSEATTARPVGEHQAGVSGESSKGFQTMVRHGEGQGQPIHGAKPFIPTTVAAKTAEKVSEGVSTPGVTPAPKTAASGEEAPQAKRRPSATSTDSDMAIPSPPHRSQLPKPEMGDEEYSATLTKIRRMALARSLERVSEDVLRREVRSLTSEKKVDVADEVNGMLSEMHHKFQVIGRYGGEESKSRLSSFKDVYGNARGYALNGNYAMAVDDISAISSQVDTVYAQALQEQGVKVQAQQMIHQAKNDLNAMMNGMASAPASLSNVESAKKDMQAALTAAEGHMRSGEYESALAEISKHQGPQHADGGESESAVKGKHGEGDSADKPYGFTPMAAAGKVEESSVPGEPSQPSIMGEKHKTGISPGSRKSSLHSMMRDRHKSGDEHTDEGESGEPGSGLGGDTMMRKKGSKKKKKTGK